MTRIALWLAQSQLKSKKPARRLRALRRMRAALNNELDSLNDSIVIKLLDHALTDAEVEIRHEAAATLGDLRDARTLKPLVRALNDRAEVVQEIAIQSLKRLDDREATDALVSKLFSGSATIQWRAAQALKSLGWRPKTDEEQIQYFAAAGELERLAIFGVPAVKKLAEIFQDGAKEKRVVAVNVLGEIDDPAVLKPLQSALRDADPLVRTAAAYALAKAGCRPAAPNLVAALKDNERNVRLAAAVALGTLGDAQTVEPLIKLLTDKDWEVRGAVLEALGKLGDTRAFQSVAARLEDKDQEVRESAAEALGRVGNESIVEKLVLTMVDAHSGVRQAAARALTRISPNWENSERVQRLLPEIQAATKNKDASIQSAAANLLRRVAGQNSNDLTLMPARDQAERRQQSIVRILQDLLRDADADLRLAAAEAIGRLRLSACADALKTARDDANKWVKLAAQSSLATLTLGESANGRSAVTFITSAAAPAPEAERPALEDFLICDSVGEVLLDWQCRDLAGWLKVLEFISGKAEQLTEVVSLGDFNRLEIQTAAARIVVLTAADRGVMLRVKNNSAPVAPAAPSASTLTDELKDRVTEWLRHAPSVRGVLVRGVRFADQTILCDVDSRDIPVTALELAFRSVSDAFHTLTASQILPTRLVWAYDRAVLHSARRADKTILGAFASAKSAETDLAGLDRQFSEFQNLSPV